MALEDFKIEMFVDDVFKFAGASENLRVDGIIGEFFLRESFWRHGDEVDAFGCWLAAIGFTGDVKAFLFENCKNQIFLLEKNSPPLKS